MASSECSDWGKIGDDYNSGMWMKDLVEIPFLEAQFKSFAEKQGGAPWKALDVGCGMGKYTVRLLQAGIVDFHNRLKIYEIIKLYVLSKSVRGLPGPFNGEGANHVLAIDLSKDMVEGARKKTERCISGQSLSAKVDLHVCSATNLSSIPGVQEGTYDIAICIFVFCTLLSKEEIKQALAEIFKMLKPGGKLFFYESHMANYMTWSSNENDQITLKPKENGTPWNYYADEGRPRQMSMRMHSGKKIEFVNRLYTLSTWVSLMLESGFQITKFLEPHLDPEDIPANAPDSVMSSTGSPIGMFWECTKPFYQ